MTITRTLRKYIEAGKLDEVESSWLTQLETDSTDISFFVAASRALKGAGEERIARTLLELLYEEWREDGALELRLELLREVGALIFDSEPLHDEVLSVLSDLYKGQPSFEGFVEQVGLHRATENSPKTWKKVSSLRAIMKFEVGSVVRMKGKGAGRVEDVNFELGSFKIGFERSPGLRVGFGGAGKLLEAIEEGHVLRRKIEDPASLEALKKNDPGGLLLITLRSFSSPRNATQVREALAGIVSEKQWSSFWTAARKSPQVVTEGKGARQRYRAVASTADAEQSVLDAFKSADIRGKLEIVRRNADRGEEIRHELATRLVAIAEASASHDFEVRFGVAHTLRGAPEVAEDAPWRPFNFIPQATDPSAIVAVLGDRVARERAYELIRNSRQDWVAVFTTRLEGEEDPKLLDRLSADLRESDPAILDSFYDRALAHPRKQAAAFIWMVERATDNLAVLDRKPFRFLQTLLATSLPAELDVFRSRWRKALEDGGPIAQLLQRIEPEQAASTVELLKRSVLESYLRDPLLEALHIRFPALREEEEGPLYATAAAIEQRRAELKELREVEIPTNRRAIEEARELGDLRENFEYKSARQRHEYLAARQAKLTTDLSRAQPLDPKRNDAEEVRVASRVTVRKEGGEPEQYLILGPWESDPDRNIVSYDSDLARSLLGKKEGESTEFAGNSYEVLAIVAWQGEAG